MPLLLSSICPKTWLNNSPFGYILAIFSSCINDLSPNNKIFSCFIIIKKFNEKGKYLNFSGKGYSISFDFLIDKKFESLKLFLNRIFEKNKLMVNFSKDSITSKKNAQNYKEFNTKTFKKI